MFIPLFLLANISCTFTFGDNWQFYSFNINPVTREMTVGSRRQYYATTASYYNNSGGTTRYFGYWGKDAMTLTIEPVDVKTACINDICGECK